MIAPLRAADLGPHGHALVPTGPLLAKAKCDERTPPLRQERRPEPDLQSLRPPGSILLVAIVSAISGAIMGCVFGGYLTVALALFIGVPVGVALGVWATGLSR